MKLIERAESMQIEFVGGIVKGEVVKTGAGVDSFSGSIAYVYLRLMPDHQSGIHIATKSCSYHRKLRKK